MNIKEIITFLEKMVDDRQDKVLPGCLGWDEIEPLQEAIALLKTHPDAQPNEPLTLEELREMTWEPAWVDGQCEVELGGHRGWAIIYYVFHETYVSVWWPGNEYADIPRLDYYGDTWQAYRRPPEEDF